MDNNSVQIVQRNSNYYGGGTNFNRIVFDELNDEVKHLLSSVKFSKTLMYTCYFKYDYIGGPETAELFLKITNAKITDYSYANYVSQACHRPNKLDTIKEKLAKIKLNVSIPQKAKTILDYYFEKTLVSWSEYNNISVEDSIKYSNINTIQQNKDSDYTNPIYRIILKTKNYRGFVDDVEVSKEEDLYKYIKSGANIDIELRMGMAVYHEYEDKKFLNLSPLIRKINIKTK
jgi:hypothetical protein